ncbi:MAG: S8 family serine peptidase, partial [Oscillospiraceae bacterium]|nr:S8 family serine peptidase [Oscillospiraceae bacterium]
MFRALALVLVLSMILSASPVAYAWSFKDLFRSEGSNNALSIEQIDGVDVDVKLDLEPVEHPYQEEKYAATESVRVSIVLKDMPTLEKFSTKGISANASAQAYRQDLRSKQAAVTASIEQRALNGNKLDVVWNLTLAGNIISANVPYGSIEKISAVAGVKEVVIEQQYAPLTGEAAAPLQSNASGMIGAGTAWAAGYTGAGTRIAVIDTGLDTDHQSFSTRAFRYALEQQAAEKGQDAASYIEGLDLLDPEEVEKVLTQLNVYPFVQYNLLTNSRGWYVNEKVPFAINYVDRNYSVTHDRDAQGGHGSHVAGIAAANRYIPQGSSFVPALDSVLTQGVAPDAQLVIMKVFGEMGGAYDSDYMVAIEDAIMLGCEVVNLSLGANKGFARSQVYQDILDDLAESDTVVAIAAGNSGAWADYSGNGMSALYGDDVDFSVIGSPSTATNSLSVASVDNLGSTDYYISVADKILYYTPGVVNQAYTDGLNVIGGKDRTYVFVDGIGTAEQAAAAAAAVENPGEAIMICWRGEISFFEKANNAAAAGFAGCIIANNIEGTINMDLTDYTGSGPCVSVTLADGTFLKDSAEELGNGLYVGTMFVSDKVIAVAGEGNVVLSEFSSWGVPGSLELKPEIAAPGGEIYSVNGEIKSGDAYMNLSGTSMASPQVAGMAAVMMQYIRENGLVEKTGISPRALATSLLMATAEPLVDGESGNYYPLLQQGAGLADLADAMSAGAYILMDEGVTSGAADGKVKAELGDDPEKTGVYNFGFTIHNFSDSDKTYSLSGDFFTQELYELDGVTYHGKHTTDLPVAASYTVGSEELVVSSALDCDLNGDGLTDAADAQAILEHAAGSLASIDAKADLNGDGKINSFDAHLVLSSLKSAAFTVAAGEEIHVNVTLELTDKAALDAYVNGAYVEGFVKVISSADAEGVIDPLYTIPVLAFYGNWSDASMYDRADYTEYTYGDFVFPYTGGLNYLSLFFGIDERYFVGNPYLIEDSFPAERAAINPETEFGDMAVTLIRNGAGFMFYILDGEGNVVEARAADQLQAAYYYEAYSAWMNVNNVGLSIWETPEQMGFKHGEKFTIGFMALPEYYEKGGALTAEDMIALMESGKIGPGAYKTYSFTVDAQAPVVEAVEKAENGNLIIKANDDQYIAAVAVLNAKGSNVLSMMGAEQTEVGETVTTEIDMTDISVNRDCIVMVADYAGNESFYTVKDYNEGINDFSGRMYGFSNQVTRGNANSFAEIDPDKLYYYTDDLGDTYMDGTTDMATMPWTVVAAEYAGGHVFMATADGKLYAAEQGDWETCYLIAESKNYAKIKDMAYDTTTGTMYALIGTANNIYSIDLADGYMMKEYSVSLAFPGSAYDSNY